MIVRLQKDNESLGGRKKGETRGILDENGVKLAFRRISVLQKKELAVQE